MSEARVERDSAKNDKVALGGGDQGKNASIKQRLAAKKALRQQHRTSDSPTMQDPLPASVTLSFDEANKDVDSMHYSETPEPSPTGWEFDDSDLSHSYWAMMENYMSDQNNNNNNASLLDRSIISPRNDSVDYNDVIQQTPATVSNDSTAALPTPHVVFKEWQERTAFTPLAKKAISNETSSSFDSLDHSEDKSQLQPFASFNKFSKDSNNAALVKDTDYIRRIVELEAALAQQSPIVRPPYTIGKSIATAEYATPRSSVSHDSLWERNQTLVKEVRFADQTCVELSQKNVALQEKINELQTQLKSYNVERESLTNQLRDKSDDLKETRSQFDAVKTNVKELTEELGNGKEESNELRKELANVSEQFDLSRQECLQSREECKVLQHQIDDNKRKLNSHTSTTNEELLELRLQYDAMYTEKLDLEGERDSFKEVNLHALEKIEQLDKQCIAYKEQLQSMHETRIHEKRQLQEEITMLKKENEDAKNTSSSNNSHGELYRENEELRYNINISNLERDVLSKELKLWKSKAATFEEKLLDLQSERDGHEQQLELLRKSCESNKKQLKSKSEELRDAQRTMTELAEQKNLEKSKLSSEVHRLQQLLRDASNEADSLRETIRQLENTNREIATRMSYLEEQLDKVSTENARLLSENEECIKMFHEEKCAMESKLNESHEEMLELQAELDDLNVNNESYEEIIVQQDSQLKSLNYNIMSLQQEKDSFAKKLASNNVAKLREQLIEKEAQATAAQQLVDTLQRRITENNNKSKAYIALLARKLEDFQIDLLDKVNMRFTHIAGQLDKFHNVVHCLRESFVFEDERHDQSFESKVSISTAYDDTGDAVNEHTPASSRSYFDKTTDLELMEEARSTGTSYQYSESNLFSAYGSPIADMARYNGSPIPHQNSPQRQGSMNDSVDQRHADKLRIRELETELQSLAALLQEAKKECSDYCCELELFKAKQSQLYSTSLDNDTADTVAGGNRGKSNHSSDQHLASLLYRAGFERDALKRSMNILQYRYDQILSDRDVPSSFAFGTKTTTNENDELDDGDLSQKSILHGLAISDLHSENAYLKKRLDQMSSMNEHASQNNELTLTLQERNQKQDELLTHYKHEVKKIAILNDKIKNHEAELEDIRSDYEQLLTIYEQKLKDISQYRSRVSSLEREKTNLSQRIEHEELLVKEARDDLLTTECSLSEARLENEMNKKSLGSLKNDMIAKTNEVTVLKKRIIQLESVNEELTLLSSQYESECTELKQHLTSTEKLKLQEEEELNFAKVAASKQEDDIRRLSARVKSLGDELDNARREVDEYSQQITEANQLRQKDRKVIVEKTNELEQVQSELDVALSKLDLSDRLISEKSEKLSRMEGNLEQLKVELKSKDEAYNKLCADTSATQTELESYRKLYDDLNFQTRDLQGLAKHMGVALESLCDEYENMRANVHILTQNLESRNDELSSLREASNTLELQLNDTKSRLEDEVRGKEVAINTLQNEFHNARDQCKCLGDELDALKSSYDGLKSETETLSAEKEAAETKLQSTTSVKSELESKCNELETTNAQIISQIRELERVREEMEKEIEYLQIGCTSCNEQLAAKCEENLSNLDILRSSEDARQAAEDLANSTESRLLSLQNDLENMRRQNVILATQVDGLEAGADKEVSELKGIVALQKSETQKLERELDLVEKEKGKLEENIAQERTHLLQVNDELSQEKEEALQRIEELKIDLHESLQNADRLTELLDNARIEVAQLHDQVKDVTAHYDSTEDKCTNLKSELDQYKTKCTRLKHYIGKLTSKCNEWEDCFAGQKKQMEEVKRKHDSYQIKIKDLEHANSDLQRTRSRLEKELSVIAKELSAKDRYAHNREKGATAEFIN